jgi:hypothetical protein
MAGAFKNRLIKDVEAEVSTFKDQQSTVTPQELDALSKIK